jgi:arylsulfatase A-like enzyme
MNLTKHLTGLLALSLTSLMGSGCGAASDSSEGTAADSTAAAADDSADEDVPPSLILISLDTLRYDHCGFNGYERDTTPFLDELAKESIVFDRAYTTMSWTLIAHMSMLTGLFPSQHGVLIPQLALTEDFPTLAERLSSEGYFTSGVYSCNWLGDRYGFSRGYDRYERATSVEEADAFVQETLEQMKPGFPSFQFIHLFGIHSGSLGRKGSTIYEPPPPFDGLFIEDAKARLAEIDARAWWNSSADPTPEQHEAMVALYDGGIRHLDSVLKGWFAEWERRGLLDNTIVVVTSDHGEGLRQRLPRYGGHGDLNVEGLQIPLLVRLPNGERGGERVDHLLSLVDIVPTVLDAAGLPKDERLPGYSAIGEARAGDQWVFAANNNVAAAIAQDRKIIYAETSPRLIYHLDEDPGELNGITPATDRKLFMETAPPLLDAALSQLGAYFQPNSPFITHELTEKAKDNLRALGYGGEIDGK